MTNTKLRSHSAVLLMALLLLLTGTGCKPSAGSGNAEAANGDKPSTSEQQQNQKVNKTFIATVDQLTLRKEPKQAAEALTLIKQGERLTYAGETTNFKDKITLRNRVYEEPWYKVTYSGKTGWVYGGAVREESGSPASGGKTRKVEVQGLNARQVEERFNIRGVEDQRQYYDKKPARYNGYYEVEENTGGSETLHGRFEVKTEEKIMNFEGFTEGMIFTAIYKGQFDKGKKYGVFTEDFSFYEGASVTSIRFDDKTGDCISISLDVEAEGDFYGYTDNSPDKCSFDYVFDEMRQQD